MGIWGGLRVVAAGALLGAAVAATPSSAAYTFSTTVTAYGPDTTNQALTVYTPTSGGTHPAVLFVHGGCWMRGTLNSAETALAQYIASKTGFVVATMTYRMTSAKWSTIPADVDAALRLLQTGGFGVDPARVALWGESAGGHLSLLEALQGTGGPGVGRAKAVVSVSGPTDLRTAGVEGAQTAATVLNCITNFEGGLPNSQAMLQRYNATSIPGHVDATDPAVFLGNSLRDPLVPPTQPGELVPVLAASRVPFTLALTQTNHHSTDAEVDPVVGGSGTLRDTAIAWLQGRL